MSKRSKKQMMYQPASQVKRRPTSTSRVAPKKARASSVTPSYRAVAQTAARLPARASLLTVRITAVVIAIVSIAGGVAWAMSTKPPFTTGLIIGLIALGFLAGLGIALALRTEEIVARVAKLVKRVPTRMK